MMSLAPILELQEVLYCAIYMPDVAIGDVPVPTGFVAVFMVRSVWATLKKVVSEGATVSLKFVILEGNCSLLVGVIVQDTFTGLLQVIIIFVSPS